MENAFTWLFGAFQSLISGLNFEITYHGFTFGLLDFLVAVLLLGVVVRNFVHIAR